MRLFVAIDLDDSARGAIAAEQRRLAAVLDADRQSLVWVAPDRMHLTLVFLGEVGDAAADGLVEAMRAPIPHAPFEAAFEGVGVFPPDRPVGGRRPPRVLWIGVTAGAAPMAAVQQEVAARVTALGLPIEDRAFHPHLTLARWRRSAWADRRRVADAARRGAAAGIHVDSATLYRSRLSSAGPSYTPLARANLSG